VAHVVDEGHIAGVDVEARGVTTRGTGRALS
jgi:hypothetical protein